MRLRRIPISAALAAFAGMLATPSFGQWPSYPAPGIPRMPDGTPNLTAPAPRTADGKPDLSGIWQVDGSGSVNGLALNVAQDLKPEDIHFWAQALYQERLLNLGKDGPMARCLPRGLPALNSFPGVFTRIVQAPGLIVILYLADPTDTFRTIFTDGRKLPEAPDLVESSAKRHIAGILREFVSCVRVQGVNQPGERVRYEFPAPQMHFEIRPGG